MLCLQIHYAEKSLVSVKRVDEMPLLRHLHKIASPVLYSTGLYPMLWRARSRREPFTIVVTYHRVVADHSAASDGFDIERGISASNFERQMRFLIRHFNPVKASQAQQCINQEIQFAVTLDDGYEDNYLIAAPILKKLGIPATFYVISDFVGTDRLFWWEQIADMMRGSDLPKLDMQAAIPSLCQSQGQSNVFPMRNYAERDYAYGQLCARIRAGAHVDIPQLVEQLAAYFAVPLREQGRHYGLMDWQQLKDLVGQGFDIGGHTATHCNLVGADEVLLRRELIDSTKVIEARLATPVESFAYPYGLFEASSKVVTDLLAKTNCKAAFTTVKGVVSTSLPATELPRTSLNRPYHFACAYNIQNTLNQA